MPPVEIRYCSSGPSIPGCAAGQPTFRVAFEGGYWHYRLINLQEEYVRKELTVAEDWRPIADICLDRMTTP
ncbi:hypothetical protein MPL3356_340028 [Mesorhizobium plurifarium]|uniref:Uncharacterized protein n=1 Tax=Mesorhizobium plurifarium TaxID=69974 RepID=A0A090DV45_MESPL|nr:hypothetical protein MPL3356_340028 [Mesorhizobium plurifarium]